MPCYFTVFAYYPPRTISITVFFVAHCHALVNLFWCLTGIENGDILFQTCQKNVAARTLDSFKTWDAMRDTYCQNKPNQRTNRNTSRDCRQDVIPLGAGQDCFQNVIQLGAHRCSHGNTVGWQLPWRCNPAFCPWKYQRKSPSRCNPARRPAWLILIWMTFPNRRTLNRKDYLGIAAQLS